MKWVPYWEFIKPQLSGTFHEDSEMGQTGGKRWSFYLGEEQGREGYGVGPLVRDQPPASQRRGAGTTRSDQLSADTKELVVKAQLRSLMGEC